MCSIFTRTTALGYYHDNFITAVEQLTRSSARTG